MIFRRKTLQNVFNAPLFQILETKYVLPEGTKITYKACSYVNSWKGAERKTRAEAENDGKNHVAAMKEIFLK